MVLGDIILHLETLAPPNLQENYDNSGLIVGSPDWEVHSALLCLDCTPEVVEEAHRKNCSLIIAHHPIVFSGLKKFNGKNYIERAIMLAIKHDIAIYAIHTNLDNVQRGVNQRFADQLGLNNCRILQPKSGVLSKLVTFIPEGHQNAVLEAMFQAGAGSIGNYSECSFQATGTGSFKASEGTTPFVGQVGTRHYESEVRVEVIVPVWGKSKIIKALIDAHPYEEVAYDLFPLENFHAQIGSGMIGQLANPMPTMEFLHFVKKQMKARCIRHTHAHKSMVKTIAICGGSGSFLLPDAIKQSADVFITSDFKYHQFFDANGQIIIADIGHFESEQYTIDLINDWLAKKFATFATHFTETETNPVQYL